ncbi:deoxyuridine 5'-triphosphate nucleotidohydrolase, mitochondrial-like [Ambystoma mexicanum]|uniref:deoxyuridine 5'-triphosphate nucleotidohydrolase, mitochondrial-like n=1 Tax=Ambystoma mexicanum TaxID=8296 RepID=UPI0037E72DF9
MSGDEEVLVPPRVISLANTSLCLEVPEGTQGRILAQKHLGDVGAGVLSGYYSGEVTVVLFNRGNYSCVIKTSQLIAQLVCRKIHVQETEEAEDRDDTERVRAVFGEMIAAQNEGQLEVPWPLLLEFADFVE